MLCTIGPIQTSMSFCRRFTISANTGYQTLERYRAEGEKGLQDRSRAPHRRPLRCSKATEKAVLSVRADQPTWGGRKIASHLHLFGAATVPAPSTITAILIRNGRLKTSHEQSAHIWLLAMLHGDIAAEELPRSIIGHPDLKMLLERLKSGRLGDRRRLSTAVLGKRSRLQIGSICSAFSFSVGKPSIDTRACSKRAGQLRYSLRASVRFGNSIETW